MVVGAQLGRHSISTYKQVFSVVLMRYAVDQLRLFLGFMHDDAAAEDCVDGSASEIISGLLIL